MGDEHPVGEEERARRAREQSHRQFAGPLDPFMREICIEEIGEVGRLHARSEADAIIGQRLVVIAGEDADELRRVDDQLEHTKQNFQSEPLIVEEVAEEYDPRLVPLFRSPPSSISASAASSASRSPCKSPTIHNGLASIHGGDLDSPIGRMVAIRVEQHAGPVGPVEQRFHPLHDGAHPCADRAGSTALRTAFQSSSRTSTTGGAVGRAVDNRRNIALRRSSFDGEARSEPQICSLHVARW